MSTDDRMLSPREHDEMRDLVMAGTQRIRPAGVHRAQFVAAGSALVLVGVVAGAVLAGALRDDPMPGPFASGDSQQTGTIPNGGTPRPGTPVDVDPQVWIGELPVGEPPLVPYWHEGVLSVSGAEITTPFDVGAIEVAGDTVMVGGEPKNGVPTEWWVVRGSRLEPLPATDEYYPGLSADGSIAFWQTRQDRETTTFVMSDTRSNQELATHTVSGWFSARNRLQMIGVDESGIAYWVDQSSETPVMRWDVRADVVEATALPWDFSRTFDDQAAPIPELFVSLADAYVSPDGTREVFTDEAPGDSPVSCCAAQLRVRPTGALASVDPSDVTALQLPDGIPGMRLWDAYTDRGTWGVWWETNETILLDAVIDGQSYLVRCWATGGSCELVFGLGANSSSGILYMPDWQQNWAFGRFPVSE